MASIDTSAIFEVTPAAFRYSQVDAVRPTDSYYGPWGADVVSSTGAPVVDSLYCAPFYAAFGGTIDRIMFNVTTGGGAGAKARCGIYDSDLSGKGLAPRNLLFDGGEFDATLVQANITTIPIPIALREGSMYWLAWIVGTAAPTVTTYTSGWHCFGRDATLAAQLGFRKTAFGYGALPATFPTAGLVTFTSNAMLVGVRFATYNRLERAGP